MNPNELRRAYRARPFRPFRIHLADGREIRVTHPENLMVPSAGAVPTTGAILAPPVFARNS